MRQMMLDLFQIAKETVKTVNEAKASKRALFEKGIVTKNGDNSFHYFSPVTGYEITMNGITVVYEDGEEPYVLKFANTSEAYSNFKYWCSTAEEEAQERILGLV